MFDESKHPRDKDGRFTYANGIGKAYRQNISYSDILADNKNQKKTEWLQRYESGALMADGKDHDRALKHAEMMYETFRNIKSDVPKIAQVTGYTEEQIRRIKNHMFFNEYELYGGKHRFDPDFYQAQSWDRLRKARTQEEIEDHDLIMLKHELVEEALMANGMGYDEAHNIANEIANYQQALEEYKNDVDKKKRN